MIAELHALGWTVSKSRHDAKSFGNWYVELHRDGDTPRLVKDRSQYMLGGPPTEAIRAAGVWQSFDDLEEFRRAILKWAKNSGPSMSSSQPTD